MENAFDRGDPGDASSRTRPVAIGEAIDESWNLRPLPQGGIVTRAGASGRWQMRSTVPEQPCARCTPRMWPRLPTATSCRGVPCSGPVGRCPTCGPRCGTRRLPRPRDDRRLRIGRAAASTSSTSSQPGTSRPLSESRSYRDPPPPGVEAFPPMPFWDRRVEGRTGIGHPPWEEYQPDRAEHGAWYHLDEPPMLDDGTLDPLALIVFADTMPGLDRREGRPVAAPAGSPRASTSRSICSTTAARSGSSRTAGRGSRVTAMRRWTWRCGTSVPPEPTPGAWSPTRPRYASSPSTPDVNEHRSSEGHSTESMP